MPSQLLVCDLDNTLYDWVDYFVPAFYAMVDRATEILGCDKADLLVDLRKVHQKHHDTEHPFALLETEIVSNHFPDFSLEQKAAHLDSAFHSFNSVRKTHLQLYDGVLDTLNALQSENVTLVAHTEGKLYSVLGRLRQLNILDRFNSIYCRERAQGGIKTEAESEEWLKKFPEVNIKELPPEDRKPNAQVLLDICDLEGFSPSDAVYVGDSIGKDIYMAQNAGVFSAWAKYGNNVNSEKYRALVAVSHWTTEDIDRESAVKAAATGTVPDLVLENSFAEILPCLKRRNSA
ncbi:HAD family hydrolase [Sulfitobacter sp. SBS6]|uniref:HAD family hydrolase n=1 Tax=Sulfitobacter sp. SBS6 TaxID=3401755 RepID=UPI003AAE58E9